ncbi:MAG TPA: glucose 1-dehydrogenase [Pseudolabrys sp.]|jgi:NAD(P)-dependent dehydrogenase (short-subunit alcohol dehydrogenase family)|nr:glucose 1-dehydrogenase [Pseudolabrys sp.]
MTSPSVLITGALTGIGRATAFAFAETGARLTISGRRDDAGRALAEELRRKGIEVEFVRTDVRYDDEVRQLVDAAVARFGRLDVAVNNAGTEGVIAPFVEQTPETYAATFDTNVLGVFLCMKYELRAMLAQGSGSIVNISSAAGKRGTAGLVLYAASKHAVEGLTKSVALEVAGSGIRVNAVAPGPIDTDMLARYAGDRARAQSFAESMPGRRLGRPEEVAAAIVFAAIGNSHFMTGHSISVDGGFTA